MKQWEHYVPALKKDEHTALSGMHYVPPLSGKGMMVTPSTFIIIINVVIIIIIIIIFIKA